MKKSVLRGEKGLAIVEFALILLPLIILIFGAIEFGLVMYNQQVITNACREGARAGIVKQKPRPNNETIKEIVKGYASGHLVTFDSESSGDLKDSDIDIDPKNLTPEEEEDLFGKDLTVKVTYKYKFLVISAFIPRLGSSLDLTAQTVMKYE